MTAPVKGFTEDFAVASFAERWRPGDLISVYSRVVYERPDNISLIYTFVFRPIVNFTISPFVSLFGAVYTFISFNKTEDVSTQRHPGKNSPQCFSGHPRRERDLPSNSPDPEIPSSTNEDDKRSRSVPCEGAKRPCSCKVYVQSSRVQKEGPFFFTQTDVLTREKRVNKLQFCPAVLSETD